MDNIEITASCHHVAKQGMEQLATIVQALDLDVDQSKTYMWSSDPEGRKNFLTRRQKSKIVSKRFRRPSSIHQTSSKQCYYKQNGSIQTKMERSASVTGPIPPKA